MKEKNQVILSKVIFFIGLVFIAFINSILVSKFNLPGWADALIVFAK